MSEPTNKQDYSQTLFLPRTDFPMRASLPTREPEILAKWQEMGLYKALRRDSVGRPPYILHDGPPYANGNIHIGHALNKVLKDVIVRSFQMRGFDANYVPGWDCHGLPIEWKIEEKYRLEGKNKDEVPVVEFRRQCREFADHWIKEQAKEFQRLGVIGDFENPYTTMAYKAEARIAGELMKFAKNFMLYRGSKPIMWSVVERTALAEAEIEYHEVISDMIWVKFAIDAQASTSLSDDVAQAFVIIWTTTPWTIPGNRAVSFNADIAYALYEIEAAENDYGPRPGEKIILAEKLAENCGNAAKLVLRKIRPVTSAEIKSFILIHPLRGFGGGYHFKVPLLNGHHVTDDAGTGFVHTAPSHGREDFDIWTSSKSLLTEMDIDPTIPFPVDDAGFYTADAPGFDATSSEAAAARVLDDHGKMGNANRVVIEQLVLHERLFARGRITHDYPHSWRSKKPVIYRNTPQWFIHMDKDFDDGKTLRQRAIKAIGETRFVPPSGQARLQSMIEAKPDWVLSRQRSWGVPIPIFAREDGEILIDDAVNERILAAFESEGADAWFASGARARFLADRAEEDWQMVTDVLDVWFDSGSTHSFTLEDRPDLDWPADLYLEGSDQHRGWFHSSLLESCGTRGRAPYKAVLTHGFTLDEKGRKMSKSLGNTINPQEIIKNSGADILRLWVMMSDYWEDQRLGKNTIQTAVDSYRKIRNVMRWMLGTLAHDQGETVAFNDLPELERLMLHRLHELDRLIRTEYDAFDFKRIIRALLDFSIVDLSAFYFDIRKDALYCEAPSSLKRKAALQVVRTIFEHFTLWLAPMLPFTTEEAWGTHFPDKSSVHLEQFPLIHDYWQDETLGERWRQIRQVRRVITGALELERANKKIGSSLEAAPVVFIVDNDLRTILADIDMAEICITSALNVSDSIPPDEAFRLDECTGIAVVVERAQGMKCARSWRYTQDVGTDPLYPDVSARDAQALREMQELG